MVEGYCSNRMHTVLFAMAELDQGCTFLAAGSSAQLQISSTKQEVR